MTFGEKIIDLLEWGFIIEISPKEFFGQITFRLTSIDNDSSGTEYQCTQALPKNPGHIHNDRLVELLEYMERKIIKQRALSEQTKNHREGQ